jgi:hypothetical protein
MAELDAACCSPAERETCCEPAAKEGCCGSGGCGCSARNVTEDRFIEPHGTVPSPGGTINRGCVT